MPQDNHEKPYIEIEEDVITIYLASGILRYTRGQFDVVLEKLPAYAVEGLLKGLSRYDHDGGLKQGTNEPHVLESLRVQGIKQGKAHRRAEDHEKRQKEKDERQEAKQAREWRETYGEG